jgi:hypothetical protein
MNTDAKFIKVDEVGGSMTIVGKKTQIKATPIIDIETEYRVPVYLKCFRVVNIGFDYFILSIIPRTKPIHPPKANTLQVYP